jgi:hypothetical protein
LRNILFFSRILARNYNDNYSRNAMLRSIVWWQLPFSRFILSSTNWPKFLFIGVYSRWRLAIRRQGRLQRSLYWILWVRIRGCLGQLQVKPFCNHWYEFNPLTYGDLDWA